MVCPKSAKSSQYWWSTKTNKLKKKKKIESYRIWNTTVIWCTICWGRYLSKWWNIQADVWELLHIRIIWGCSLYHCKKPLRLTNIE
jgi:hypothetical protein